MQVDSLKGEVQNQQGLLTAAQASHEHILVCQFPMPEYCNTLAVPLNLYRSWCFCYFR